MPREMTKEEMADEIQRLRIQVRQLNDRLSLLEHGHVATPESLYDFELERVNITPAKAKEILAANNF